MAEGPIRDFLGNSDGEWVIQNGDFGTVAGADAVRQGIENRVRLFKGENFIDETQGIPYIDNPDTGDVGILNKGTDPLVIRGVIGDAIGDTPDVTNVVGAQLLGPDADREASIDYSVDTVYSQQPLAAQVEVP